MIYIYKNRDNEITTDNIVNFIPDNLIIYLDDILIGTYVNTSTYKAIIEFTIPLEDISTLQEKEYNLIITNNLVTIKQELAIIKEVSTFEIKTINKTNKITMYD
jgi:hypothetical protein